MTETKAEEIARLKREIGERQSRLEYLVLGDPLIGVYGPIEPFAGLPVHLQPTVRKP